MISPLDKQKIRVYKRVTEKQTDKIFTVSFYAWVAQSVEQRTENPCVGGSIPSPGTTFHTIIF